MNRLFFISTLILLLVVLISWIAGNTLTKPAQSKIELPAAPYNIGNIEINGVHGWYIPAKEHKACILLMHSVRSNRKEMLGRAKFLREKGYSSFAIDLQAHGETIGEKITYGYLESNSARIAVQYLYKNKLCKKVVSIGSSLGGAASLLGQHPIDVDGYILEGVYSGIEKAVENRLSIHLGNIGQYLAPILYMQIPQRLDIDLDSLQPSKAISRIKAPVLIMNGSLDMRTTISEAKEMYNNAPAPKEFFEFKGAAHTNLYNFNPVEYKRVVLEFLGKYIDQRT